jgi:hypothetical protein
MARVVSIATVAIAGVLGASGGGWLADYSYMRFFGPTVCNDVITSGVVRFGLCLMPSPPWWGMLGAVLFGGLILGAAATWILRALRRHAAATG